MVWSGHSAGAIRSSDHLAHRRRYVEYFRLVPLFLQQLACSRIRERSSRAIAGNAAGAWGTGV